MEQRVAPILTQLRHLHRPLRFVTHPRPDADKLTLGQRMAERVAASVGSWWFLGGQAFFLLLWVVYNTLQVTSRFDPPPYILLNLLLSFQAAFTGPVLLIAANVGASRDHRQADRIEHLVAQNEQMEEQNRTMAEQIVNLERMIDEHVSASMRAHSEEIRAVYALMREVHTAVTGRPAPQAQPAPAARPSDDASESVANAAASAAPQGAPPDEWGPNR